jgi:hypothetical protein
MGSRVQAAVACCLVANYLLAITVGTSFHTHSGPRCTASADGCHHHCEPPAGGTADDHPCCPPGHGEDSAWTSANESSAGHGADACPICEFLAQRPVASRPIPQVAYQLPRRESALLPVIWHVRRVSSTCRVRGPPA